MEQSAPVSIRKSKDNRPRRVRTRMGITGLATRPREMTLVPRGNSTGVQRIDANRFLGRDVADDQRLTVQTALANGIEQRSVGFAAGEDFAILSSDEFSAVPALEFCVGNDFDRGPRFHDLSLSRALSDVKLDAGGNSGDRIRHWEDWR